MIPIAIKMLPALLVKLTILYNAIASLTFNCSLSEPIVYLGLVYTVKEYETTLQL